MRTGKYQLYSKVILEYYFYRTIVKDDGVYDRNHMDHLLIFDSIHKKFLKIPSSSRHDVLKKLMTTGLLKTYTHYGITLHELTEKGVKQALKIMSNSD